MPTRTRRPKRLTRRRFLGAGCAALAGAGAVLCLRRRPKQNAAPAAEPTPPAPAPRREYRAVWLSYLELAGMDFSSAERFRAGAETLLDNCVSLGLNTVLVQLRPFGDALYESRLYPWSHLCTGVQGRSPGFDPLEILIEEAHRRALSLEGWLNPYRLRMGQKNPPVPAENSLLLTHPDWVYTCESGQYLNPALPEAADYVAAGVVELVERYAVDGVHFDDYFYPTTAPDIDAAQFAASGRTDLDGWRREQVTSLLRRCYRAVKAADPTLRFGVSPQGNPDNNFCQQYSDTARWLATGGEEQLIDYLCPQIYWGPHYTLPNGSTRFAFENLLPEWLGMTRAEGVSLYFGLGCWRIGEGDHGANEDSVAQWSTGHALADQLEQLRALGAEGYALYRYGSLFASDWPELAEAECAALAAANLDPVE